MFYINYDYTTGYNTAVFHRAIFQNEYDSKPTIKSLFSTVPDDIKREQNIHTQMRLAETKTLLAIQDSDRVD